MELSAFFQRRAMAGAPTPPSGPRPALLFTPSALSATSWRNDGQLGSGYDLVPTSAGTVTYLPAAGGQRPYVESSSSGHLVTAADLPNSLLGGRSRTLGFWVQQPTAATVNFVGYGGYGNGYLFDIMRYNRAILTPHMYGQQITTPGDAYMVGAWNNIVVVIDFDGVSTTTVRSYLNGQLAFSGPVVGLDTQASPLHVGGGVYSSYNASVRIGGLWLEDKALTNSEINTFNTLLTF